MGVIWGAHTHTHPTHTCIHHLNKQPHEVTQGDHEGWHVRRFIQRIQRICPKRLQR
ncbi:MAG: hypothetical protein BYD32DRAFT_46302 [Podila humilis]|nr:MAG: hypothetical protein BYD32DRAFT_46302 [Podila humilis]